MRRSPALTRRSLGRCSEGDLAMVKLLVEKGADVNKASTAAADTDPQDGRAPRKRRNRCYLRSKGAVAQTECETRTTYPVEPLSLRREQLHRNRQVGDEHVDRVQARAPRGRRGPFVYRASTLTRLWPCRARLAQEQAALHRSPPGPGLRARLFRALRAEDRGRHGQQHSRLQHHRNDETSVALARRSRTC